MVEGVHVTAPQLRPRQLTESVWAPTSSVELGLTVLCSPGFGEDKPRQCTISTSPVFGTEAASMKTDLPRIAPQETLLSTCSAGHVVLNIRDQVPGFRELPSNTVTQSHPGPVTQPL